MNDYKLDKLIPFLHINSRWIKKFSLDVKKCGCGNPAFVVDVFYRVVNYQVEVKLVYYCKTCYYKK